MIVILIFSGRMSLVILGIYMSLGWKYFQGNSQNKMDFIIYADYILIQGFCSISASILYTSRCGKILECFSILKKVDKKIKEMDVGFSYDHLRHVLSFVTLVAATCSFGVQFLPLIFDRDNIVNFLISLVGFGYPTHILIQPIYYVVVMSFGCRERFIYLEKILKKLSKCENSKDVIEGLSCFSTIYEQLCDVHKKLFYALGYQVLVIYLFAFFQSTICIIGVIFTFGNVQLVDFLFCFSYICAMAVTLVITTALENRVRYFNYYYSLRNVRKILSLEGNVIVSKLLIYYCNYQIFDQPNINVSIDFSALFVKVIL